MIPGSGPDKPVRGVRQPHRLPRRIQMKQRAFVITLLLCLPAIAFAQQDGPYQVRYATNLNISDSIIDVTNTGANGSPAICVNVYGLTGPKLVHCCTCIVKSDALVALSVQKDLLANNNFPPDSLVI